MRRRRRRWLKVFIKSDIVVTINDLRLKIVIYNRLGTVVYKFSGTGNEYKGNRWEGKTNKSLLPVGSYYYVIEADDSKPLTGSVTIAR